MALRLATRAGLAAMAATAVTVGVVGIAVQGQFAEVLRERVDRQLVQRAETAPILAAVADRLARSELRGTVSGARVATATDIVEVGLLPEEALPQLDTAGWSTVRADGQAWRLYTVEVLDVPRIGDRALVQEVAPLGDVDAQAAQLRRRALAVASLAAAAAGLVGYALGAWATRPLARLRRDTSGVGGAAGERWQVAASYGPPEVDDIATTLNATLAHLRVETEGREAALEAARSFAASANHELRTPLQGALTNLDIAASPSVAPPERAELVELARAQLHRMAAALGAVGLLAEADLADASWFTPLDLAEVAADAAEEEARRSPGATLEVTAPAGPLRPLWGQGVALAVGNLVRNALRHGRRPGGAPVRVAVTVAGATVTVDDDGPGIPVADRERVLARFARGDTSAGTGLGLAFVQQVARAHGGEVTVTASPLGGARVVLALDRVDPTADA